MSTILQKKRAAAVAASGPEKKIKVQIGICRRMMKEVEAYEKEVIHNEGRIQKMKDDGKDEYDIRKQEEVLQESYMMVPDSKSRCETAMTELDEALAEAQDEGGVDQSVQNEARALLDLYRSKL